MTLAEERKQQMEELFDKLNDLFNISDAKSIKEVADKKIRILEKFIMFTNKHGDKF